MSTKKSIDILGIGICTVDHLVSIPHMPAYGSLVRTDHYLQQAGGLVASALVAAQRLGAVTKVISRIGDDAEGSFIRADLNSEGIDTSSLLLEANTKSHLSIVLVDEHTGERSFISRWATGAAITSEDLDEEEVKSAKLLFLDNVTEGTLVAAKWAKEAGVQTVLDPVCDFKTAQDILPFIDIPIVPEVFAKNWLPNESPEIAAQSLIDLGAEIAVVTLGDKGGIVATSQGTQTYPAFPVKVKDTTGAGDAFHGAFMYGLLQEWDVSKIAAFASAVGALNCRYLGGRQGLPSKQEVEQFMQETRA